MLDLPELSKKRMIEMRNLNILSFEAFLKIGNSEVMVIEEYAVNLISPIIFQSIGILERVNYYFFIIIKFVD